MLWKKKEVFVFVPRADADWDPHTSYHQNATFHSKKMSESTKALRYRADYLGNTGLISSQTLIAYLASLTRLDGGIHGVGIRLYHSVHFVDVPDLVIEVRG